MPPQRRGHALPLCRRRTPARAQPLRQHHRRAPRPPDGRLYTALTTGTGARQQPFTLWISTAGVDAPGILVELHASMFDGPGELEDRGSLLVYRDRANGVLIWWYGAPRDADIEDPGVWLAANPASWLRDGTYLSREYARLRARGALLDWRRFHLNQFVGTEEAWLPEGSWTSCRVGDPDPADPLHGRGDGHAGGSLEKAPGRARRRSAPQARSRRGRSRDCPTMSSPPDMPPGSSSGTRIVRQNHLPVPRSTPHESAPGRPLATSLPRQPRV